MTDTQDLNDSKFEIKNIINEINELKLKTFTNIIIMHIISNSIIFIEQIFSFFTYQT